MNLYISDTHFGHKNVIKFDHRPFSCIEEMDEMIIHLWNGRVSDDDDVWFLGDFCHRSGRTPDWYLRRLKGRKHLIIGNHDTWVYGEKGEQYRDYFETIDQIARVDDVVRKNNEEEKVKIVLCHYPILEWWHKHHGVYHIYGHIHTDTGDTFRIISQFDHALNAAAAINNYTPASLRELIENNRRFQERVKHHDYENDRYSSQSIVRRV